MNDLFSPLTVAGLYHGDSRDVLKTLPDNSIDSVVTDPPYALVSIVKRFGGKNAAPAKSGASGVYARASAGFMGQSWDTGEVAFAAEFWSEVYRVLKPGGHVVSFGGTRTYHRMTCAIEDAGFEIRDQLQWLYGTGFPKSHDVSKAIDKSLERMGMFGPFARHYAERRKESGLTHSAICEVGKFYAEHNHGGASTNWEKGNNVPTMHQWSILQPLLGLSGEWLPLIERVEAEREVIGQQSGTKLAVAPGQENDRSATELDITRPATAEAEQWNGFGTALKPANEPICLARKPLDGTVAENVLKWGTGAINIDGCRIPHVTVDSGNLALNPHLRASINGGNGGKIFPTEDSRRVVVPHELGRFPANVITDGSVEMPNGAQRFFYCAKASRKDRNEGLEDPGPQFKHGSTLRMIENTTTKGNNHPTVKPTDLMRWLCRLVTPPGGIVLDPFMGSGSTGKAARLEGFQFVGIEREEQYFNIAKERVK